VDDLWDRVKQRAGDPSSGFTPRHQLELLPVHP
jgi:hypothetical protein